MTNNDYLRSLRFILNLKDQNMAEILALAGINILESEMSAYLKNEEEAGFIKCEDKIMASFLDGLIYYKRGKDENRPPLPQELPITNNIVLKKLRVAFQLKEEDMHHILSLVEFPVGRAELSALLRRADHHNFRECGDQLLRNFFKGLVRWTENGSQ